MSRPNPKVDPRRADDLFRELLERVRTWIPTWQPPTESDKDFGHALLHIAARLSAEVTERLDRTPAKLALGLLDWLGIKQRAGHAARMPVVFKMANGTTDSVLATAPVRIQANVGDTPIAFETQEDVRLVPSPIQQLVGVDPAQDKIYFPPAEVLSLEAPESGPTEWTPKSLAIADGKNKKIQLNPALGLKVGTILQVKSKVNDREYRFEYRLVAEPDGDIVTVEPPIGSLDPGSPSVPVDAKDIDADTTTVSKVSSFIPFDGSSRNRQEHALYIGDDNALNLSAPACIALSGGAGLPGGLEWEYWGKVGENEPDWQGLKSLGPEGTNLFLKKADKGSVEIFEINGRKSRWIRARRTASDKHSTFSQLGLLINCSPTSETSPDSVAAKCIPASDAEPPKLEGVANNTSLVLSDRFYPFGKAPRQFDSFFLACPEVFSKKGAHATITLEIADLTLGRLAVAPLFEGSDSYLVFGVSKDGSLHRYKLSSDPNQPVSYLEPTRPKPPTGSGTGSTVDKTPVFQGAEFAVAPVTLYLGPQIHCVFVASGRDVWGLLEATPYYSEWRYFGKAGNDKPGEELGSISELIILGPDFQLRPYPLLLIALAEGVLYRSFLDINSSWQRIDSRPDTPWQRIAAIHDAKARTVTRTDSFVALDNTGKIVLFNFNTTQNTWVETEIKKDDSLDDSLWDARFTPLVVSTATSREVLLVGKPQYPNQQHDLLALVLTIPEAGSQSASISGHFAINYSGSIIGNGFDFWVDEFDTVHVLFALNTPPADIPRLAWWAPLDGNKLVLSDPVGASGMGGTLAEAPTVAGSRIVVPGISLDLMVTKLKTEPVGIQKPKDSSLLEGIITSKILNAKDLLELLTPNTEENKYFTVGQPSPVKKDNDTNNLYLTDPPLAEAFVNVKIGQVFPSTAMQFQGTGKRVFSPNQLKLDNILQNPASGDTLLLEYEPNNNLIYSEHKVNTFDLTTKTVTLEEKLPDNVPNITNYQLYKPVGGKRIAKPDQLSLIDITLGLIVDKSVLLLEYKKGNALTYSKHTVTAVNQATNTVTITPKLPSDDVDITTLKFQLYDFALEANVNLPNQLQLKTIPSDLVKESILILKYNQDSNPIYSLHIVKDVSVTEDDSDTKTIITVSPNLPTVLKLNFQLYNAFPVEKDEEQNEKQTQLKRAAIPPGLVENILLLEYKQDSTLAYSPCIVTAVNLRNNTVTFSPELPADVKSNKLKFQLHNTLKIETITQPNQLHLDKIPPGLVVNDILLLEYELDGADGTLVHSPHIVTTVDSHNNTVTFSPDMSTDAAKSNTFKFQLYNAFQGERVLRPTNQLQLLNGIPDGLAVGKELLLKYQQNNTLVYSKRGVVEFNDQLNNIITVGQPDLPENIDKIELEYQLYEPLKGNRVLARNLLQLSGNDLQSPKDSILLLYKPGGSLPCSKHTVYEFYPLKNIIEVNPFLPENLGDTLPCFLYKKTDIIKIDIIIRPVLLLKEFNDESLKILGETGTLYFKSPANPQRQSLAYEIAKTTLPDGDQQVINVAVLETPWRTRPTKDSDGNLEVAVEVKPGQDPWFRFIGDRSSNPELSWEYCREGGWWGIPGLKDFTANLKANLKRSDTKLVGTIEFEVPTDLQPTDVLGQQSYWIRARLVGGNYGKETFVTTTTWTGERTQTQTQSVVVNTDNIRAPLVLSIKIAYSICTPITPKYLLTFDSGSWRDQSDANRTGGATVDAFVPISERLRQMSGTAASPAGSPATAVAPCGCGNVAVSATVTGAPAETPTTKASEASDSRAIYLAFANKLEGGSIKLLFLLEDKNHDAAAPLIVEALRDNHFEPVNAQDDTRALGESGVITLSLDASPTQTELFGFPGFWIRLRPYKPEAPWRPRIRGAYANAVWAKAVETQDMEILGSSDGSPAQRFALIRSPILENGLELRVREPLGDEEMKQLIRTDKTVVKEDVPGLPGRWVRWTEIPDPGDAGPGDRVYALDFASGEIRFGDGAHGAIPPIGRDAVVAFQYRCGGKAAANAVPPFTPLNLVTPIEGVEAAITPDHAAGGADPEADAAVLRFASAKLRHRDRALTLKDLEDLALNYSPFIAQARAFTTTQSTRLVVVIAGSNPDPNQALARELKRYLLDHASPALARKDALSIDKPEQVKFRLQISLSVASLDVTGRIVKETTEKVKAFFDPASGGYDGLGWRLGDSPTDADVAAQLIAIENIEGIGNIRFSRVGDTATATERLPIKSDQLAWLAPDGIKIEFSTGMVTT